MFSLNGRAIPLKQWTMYMAYTVVITLLTAHFVPNYANVQELKGLQFPVTALGELSRDTECTATACNCRGIRWGAAQAS